MSFLFKVEFNKEPSCAHLIISSEDQSNDGQLVPIFEGLGHNKIRDRERNQKMTSHHEA